ncbi:MAG: hypothetical protein H6Q31_969 [Bacteroidetes bacterium]|nr:hypothetical protein [Bacteroidota bacterium]
METRSAALPEEWEFEGAISSLTAQTVHKWETSPAVFPTNMPTYGRSEKGANEKRILRVLDDQDKRRDLQTLFRNPGGITGSTLRRLAITDLFVLPDPGNSPALPSGQFADATADFVRRARMFDPDIPSDQLAQALRNLWVFCSFQYLADLPIAVTPSAVAYSLLYPYTDNFLDDREVNADQKKRFGARIGTELQSPGQEPEDAREAAVFALIGMIAEEFPRTAYPLIHKSLQAIHAAQCCSIGQQGSAARADVLRTSMMKGGTSVLVDALIAGSVRDWAWLDMAFEYGCVLQLVDDLQDAKKDTELKHRTIFATESYPQPLESESLHLLKFLYDLIPSWELPTKRDRPSFTTLMAGSCSFLIFEAVARARPLFSTSFLRRADTHAPVSLEFLAGLRERAQH